VMRVAIVSESGVRPSVTEIAEVLWRAEIVPSAIVAEASPAVGDAALRLARRTGVPGELVPVGSGRLACRVAVVLLPASGSASEALWARCRAGVAAGLRVVIYRRGARRGPWVWVAG
jgi:hypothetical protein